MKKKPGGGAAGNPNSLANLKRGNPATLVPGAGPKFEPGRVTNLRGGARTRNPSPDALDHELRPVMADLIARLDADDPELAATLNELAPKVSVRDEHGDVPAWLSEQVFSTAIKRLIVTRLRSFVATHDTHDGKGKLRPELEQLSKATESYERSLARLAMTVESRARVGLDVARTAQSTDLALLWAQEGGDDAA